MNKTHLIEVFEGATKKTRKQLTTTRVNAASAEAAVVKVLNALRVLADISPEKVYSADILDDNDGFIRVSYSRDDDLL